ncbi:GntR family transcriptional regulator [Lampropedia cohaerens]|uniref:GntR family transcriptional regulator n=1 Tax=Lampropedia cohaerens TaxID=1610491 RepID=A0A0U1PYZ3_9BURK|nr:PLP-dependent aminotransferase family protein [Lampropedia cohaerens]KKW67730.1 GntR family transcriptional regulator [Lampropedia cohaerens]
MPKHRTATRAQQLADTIERQILSGVYKAGDKLPSLRELAALHHYAKNTVVASFEMLVNKGLVEPRRGSGYYVCAHRTQAEGTPPPHEEDRGNLGRAMDIVWLMREQLKTRAGALSVGDGFPPSDWLADVRLDRFHSKVVRTGLGALFRYGNRFGYSALRESIIGKLADIGVGAEPTQVVLTQGANEAMDLVIRYFVPPGGKVLVDDPGYYPLFGKLKVASAQVLGVPRQTDGPDLEALEQLLIAHRPRLFFTQSLAHNPTGSDLSAAKAYRVLQLAHKYNLLLVEDDPLADFKPTASTRLSALDQLERTIYIGSFSKSFSAALRVGFIACDAALASDLADLKALVHVASSEYSERTVDVMLREGHYQRHITRLRKQLARATQQALQLFNAIGANVFAQNAQSLYLWATLPGITDSTAFAQRMLRRDVVMAPGRIFTVDASISPWARFNVGAVADPRFMEALRQELGIRM